MCIFNFFFFVSIQKLSNGFTTFVINMYTLTKAANSNFFS